jgi:tetratricopeptide (TPR) repeat protein
MVSGNQSTPGPRRAAIGARGEEARQDYEQARENCLAAVAEEGQVDACIRLGALAAEAGRWEEAAEALKAAIALDPRCAEAYGSLAMIHHRREQYPQAVEMYLQCLQLNSDNLIALLGLFQTCCKMGSFAVIIRYLEIYLAGHPRDVAVLFCLATLYARDGELHKARGVLRTILGLEPAKAEALDLLAQVEAALARAPAGPKMELRTDLQS